jgi:hypothetical protein
MKIFQTQIPSLPLKAEERARERRRNQKRPQTLDNIMRSRDQKLLSPALSSRFAAKRGSSVIGYSADLFVF